MSEMFYEEENIINHQEKSRHLRKSKMSEWLIEKSWVKDEKGASLVLSAIIIICIILSIVVLKGEDILRALIN